MRILRRKKAILDRRLCGSVGAWMMEHLDLEDVQSLLSKVRPALPIDLQHALDQILTTKSDEGKEGIQ